MSDPARPLDIGTVSDHGCVGGDVVSGGVCGGLAQLVLCLLVVAFGGYLGGVGCGIGQLVLVRTHNHHNVRTQRRDTTAWREDPAPWRRSEGLKRRPGRPPAVWRGFSLSWTTGNWKILNSEWGNVVIVEQNFKILFLETSFCPNVY